MTNEISGSLSQSQACRESNGLAYCYTLDAMKPIDEIRRSNLKMLATRYGGVGRLAEKLDRASAQVSQWINASRDSKTGKPRTISNRSARFIERTLGLPENWLDHDHDATGAGAGDDVGAEVLSRTRSIREMLDQLRERLRAAPDEVRHEVNQLVMRYMDSDDEDSASRLLRAIEALLDEHDGHTAAR